MSQNTNSSIIYLDDSSIYPFTYSTKHRNSTEFHIDPLPSWGGVVDGSPVPVDDSYRIKKKTRTHQTYCRNNLTVTLAMFWSNLVNKISAMSQSWMERVEIVSPCAWKEMILRNKKQLLIERIIQRSILRALHAPKGAHAKRITQLARETCNG